MSRLRARRAGAHQDVDIDMVPIMNMFLVLIPFLLISANFLHLKAINTSVPVLAEPGKEAPGAGGVRVTVVVRLGERGIRLSALSDRLGPAELKALEGRLPLGRAGAYPLADLAERLRAIKARYPRSDTLILVPHDGALYETIIRTMDAARRSGDDPLFPNVVLSGKVG